MQILLQPSQPPIPTPCRADAIGAVSWITAGSGAGRRQCAVRPRCRCEVQGSRTGPGPDQRRESRQALTDGGDRAPRQSGAQPWRVAQGLGRRARAFGDKRSAGAGVVVFWACDGLLGRAQSSWRGRSGRAATGGQTRPSALGGPRSTGFACGVLPNSPRQAGDRRRGRTPLASVRWERCRRRPVA